jgi:HK97 family phage major capsid protein
MKLQELLDKRAALIKQAREVLDTADAEKRNMSAEERSKYDAIMADVDDLNEDIKRVRQVEQAERNLEKRDDSGIRPEVVTPENRSQQALSTEEYRSAYLSYLRQGMNIGQDEFRAMSIGSAGNGGYLVPTELANAIMRSLPDVSAVRNHARVIQLQHDREIPIANDRGVVYWTGEASDYTESTPSYAKEALGAYKLTYLVKLSEELLADTGFDLFAELSKNYADLAGAAMEAKFCQGTGTGEIGGLIAGGSAGKVAAAADALVADELIDFIYSLKKQYRRKGIVLLNGNTAKAIRKLKNGSTGEYLWQPALAAGQPDSLLGHPVEESEGMPDIAADATPIIFGDLSYYTIAERGTRSIQRLNERYADKGQVGFRVFERLDGAVMLPEAIKKLTMGSGV